MHSFSSFVLILTMFGILHGQTLKHRSCPEEYGELRRQNDESDSDSSEELCEQAMRVAARQPNPSRSQYILRTYCQNYDEVQELARKNNDETCEEKKRQIEKKRKRNDHNDDDDSSDSDEDKKKRRGLARRQLKKRLALRFLHKRLA